jgi:hypothetical protein
MTRRVPQAETDGAEQYKTEKHAYQHGGAEREFGIAVATRSLEPLVVETSAHTPPSGLPIFWQRSPAPCSAGLSSS